jgi:hypothetical protein
MILLDDDNDDDDDDDDDDDEYKPVWPSGLWATSQGEKMYSRQPHLPFIEAFWQSTSLRSSGTC